eukprot:TRINITY_DN20699_c0_g1_i2.p1 TRINITY_DN20699_c0_g1~~TRINITY_DN20699_c0_g1_i2.p1  ORF type:complete len:417 (+),score=187.31 TRINITY_DN20699_c0_g1_i2:102-1352(+)
MKRCRALLRCTPNPDDGPVVTPWGVTGGSSHTPVKYDTVMSQFGSEPLTPEIVTRFAGAARGVDESLGREPRKLHRFLRRGIAFTHRGIGDALGEVEKGRKVYLYTGRGPSDQTMHIGHAVPFLLTQYLQEQLDTPLVVQLTDDEKFLFRDIDMDRLRTMTRENIKDILAFGFDPEKTFVFNNLNYMQRLYPNTLRIQRQLTFNKVAATFGFEHSDNIGKIAFPAIQAAPCFSSSFPQVLPVAKMRCLIPCAIDQDPFFMLTRDVCPKLKNPKPSLLMTKFLAPLSGVAGKMSSSGAANSQVLLTDDRKTVQKKLKSAFSGGAATLKDFQRDGGNPEIDIAFQYLRHFLEDDEELAELEDGFRRGKVHSGTMKLRAAEVISDFLDELQARRASLTDEAVDYVMSERSILPFAAQDA